MHRVVEDQLEHDVQDDPQGEQSSDGRRAASQQFSSLFRTEDQREQVRLMYRPGIGETAANP
jgi:hypothetical protein